MSFNVGRKSGLIEMGKHNIKLDIFGGGENPEELITKSCLGCESN